MTTTKGLAVVVISHQRARLSVLEQVNLDVAECGILASALAHIDGNSEAVVLSTCNRTELYLAGPAPDVRAAVRALAEQCRTTQDLLERSLWHAFGPDVARHLFRVAAGLESRIAGEREILGQVRTAIATARSADTVGSHLDCLFRSAIAVGRRVQHTDHTAPAMLSQVGLDAARPDGARTGGLTVVMGAGLMAAATVRELIARGDAFVVCARRLERAAMLAKTPEQLVPFDDLQSVLERAEVVVCATGARAPLVSVADLEVVMARRNDRPLVIVDLSLPRNVDPAAGQIPGLRLLDLEDLVSGSSMLELQRRSEIVDGEFRRFCGWLAGHVAGHMIAQLHEGVQAICRDALEMSLAETGLDSSAVAAASRTIAGRLLHAPTLAIRTLMAEGDEQGAHAILASYGISGPTGDTVPAPRSVRLVDRSRHRTGRVRIRPAAAAMAS